MSTDIISDSDKDIIEIDPETRERLAFLDTKITPTQRQFLKERPRHKSDKATAEALGIFLGRIYTQKSINQYFGEAYNLIMNDAAGLGKLYEHRLKTTVSRKAVDTLDRVLDDDIKAASDRRAGIMVGAAEKVLSGVGLLRPKTENTTKHHITVQPSISGYIEQDVIEGEIVAETEEAN